MCLWGWLWGGPSVSAFLWLEPSVSLGMVRKTNISQLYLGLLLGKVTRLHLRAQHELQDPWDVPNGKHVCAASQKEEEQTAKAESTGCFMGPRRFLCV